jgi:signal transduction histidine kinase
MMPGLPGGLRLPRRTARLRLTMVYSAAFLACSVAVVAFIYLFYGHLVHFSNSLPTSRVIGPPGGVSLEQKTAAARAAAIDAQVNAALAEAARKPGVRESLLQVKSLADKQVLAQIHFAMAQLLISCAIALAIIAVAAAAIGWFIAGRVLRPLSTITAAARRISASSLHERLALPGPDDELKELADTLDNLFERLEAAFGAQRRFAANASHELRTPLTRERTLLQVTLADPASTIDTWRAVSRELLAANAEQEYLIDALLTLASSESGTGVSEPLDLAAAAREALAAAGPAISRLGLRVQAGIQPAILDGDPLLVQQLVTNLIDNAVRHNVPGGDVLVATRTSSGRAVLSVANSGPVIPAAAVGRLFQPFQRLGPRPARRDGHGHGHGLGLSIVRAIATAHGATIEARAWPEGGLVVDVAFLPPGGQRHPIGPDA